MKDKLNITIEYEAFRILLRTLLSCRCPVSEWTEKNLTDLAKDSAGKKTIDYNEILEIAKPDGETPFSRLKDFRLYSVRNLDGEILITLDDVLLHFCTEFHWTRAVAQHMNSSYRKVTDMASWFVGHMLLPVRIKDEKTAEYFYEKESGEQGVIVIKNIFIPNAIELEEGGLYCLHFASVVGKVDEKRFRMIKAHLSQLDLFRQFREEITEIDYSNFQRFGDYKKTCRDRYFRHFG